jgi:predicted Zn-dependent protease
MGQEDYSLRTRAVLVAAAVLLGACAARPPTEPPLQPLSQPLPMQPAPPLAPAPPASSLRPPEPPPREIHLSPATRSLVTQAQTQAAHGDLPAASSTLDRALRIEPNNPLIWIELGRLRLTEIDAHQAEVCGRKALALASGDRGTQRQAGQLLADALRAQGRNQEAREVESQPFMH